MAINMIKGLGSKMDEQGAESEIFHKELENIKKN